MSGPPRSIFDRFSHVIWILFFKYITQYGLHENGQLENITITNKTFIQIRHKYRVKT